MTDSLLGIMHTAADSLVAIAHRSEAVAHPAANGQGAFNWWDPVSAIGTALAVVVALLGETFWRWWRRPILKAHVLEGESGCFYKSTVRVGTTQTQAYYLRLWIENEGKRPGKDVQVFASALTRRDDKGHFQPEREFLPIGLLWTHLDPPSATLRRLHPRIGHHCELGQVLRTSAQLFDLLIEVQSPYKEWHRLRAGAYRITLRLACANGEPTTQTVEFEYDGKWRDDETAMFRDGLKCRMVEGGTKS